MSVYFPLRKSDSFAQKLTILAPLVILASFGSSTCRSPVTHLTNQLSCQPFASQPIPGSKCSSVYLCGPTHKTEHQYTGRHWLILACLVCLSMRENMYLFIYLFTPEDNLVKTSALANCNSWCSIIRSGVRRRGTVPVKFQINRIYICKSSPCETKAQASDCSEC